MAAPSRASRHRSVRWTVATVVATGVVAATVLGGCGAAARHALPPVTTHPTTPTSKPVPTTTKAPPTTTTAPPTTTTAPPTTTTVPPTTTTVPPTTTTAPPTTMPTTAPALGPGASGPAVVALQQRLTALGYWLGTANGTFGDSTEQAVYALQKAAGITRDGVVGPQTETALDRGVVPQPRPASGYLVEVDLADDLLMFVTDGKLLWTLNTSTGGGYVYTTDVLAETPIGVFSIFREVDGMVIDSLGELWRPKFFYTGFAIHGDTYVPPYPVSHGCVRVSDEAIDWIWTQNMLPLGTTVWIYT